MPRPVRDRSSPDGTLSVDAGARGVHPQPRHRLGRGRVPAADEGAVADREGLEERPAIVDRPELLQREASRNGTAASRPAARSSAPASAKADKGEGNPDRMSGGLWPKRTKSGRVRIS